MKFNIRSIIIPIALIATIIVILISLYHTSDSKLPKKILIDTNNQPTIGNQQAKIHMVVFEDLKCYNCMRYNAEIYPSIEKNYIKTGKASYTVINLAFIPGSMTAANAARCVYKQDKKLFFTYLKNIYDNQPPETENWATIPNLMNFAKNIPGLNKEKLSVCIEKSPYTYLINNNLKIAIKAMNGAAATPTLYINGYIVKPLTLNQIHQIIKATT